MEFSIGYSCSRAVLAQQTMEMAESFVFRAINLEKFSVLLRNW